MSSRALFAFVGVCLLWGVPYLLIKIAVDEVSPTGIAFARCAVGAAVLAPIAWQRGAFRGLWARRGVLVVFALAEIIVPFPLVAAGEQEVSSSVAAILIASLPLVIASINVRTGDEARPAGLRLAGLVVGFAGVVALLGLDVAGRPSELLGAAAIMVAVLGYAIGPMVVARHLRDTDPLGPVCVALALATVALAPAAALTAPHRVPSSGVLASLLVLGVACSAAAFVLMFVLVSEIGPGRASVITYINPVIAVTLGVLLLGETLGPAAIAGLLAILAGSWLGTGGGLPRPPALVGRRRIAPSDGAR